MECPLQIPLSSHTKGGVKILAEIVANNANYLNLVGKQIKKYRKSLQLTQEQLAEAVGGSFSAKALSRYEKGETQMGIGTYFDLAKALDVSPNDLAPQELLGHSEMTEYPAGYLDLDTDNKQIVDMMVSMLLQKQRKQR